MNDAAIHFGMGRVGTGTYDFLLEHHGDLIIGCDSEPVTAKRNLEAGRNVHPGYPTDLDFWERQDVQREDKIRLALLTMPKFTANMEADKLINQMGFDGLIVASARFDDEVKALKDAGVKAYNFYGKRA